MTLDEAIQRENKIAEENQKIVDTQIVFDDVSISELYCDDTEVIEEHLNNYKKCAEYHNQIAEWLEELKMYKSLASKELVSEKQRNDRNIEYIKCFNDGYKNALYDFSEKIKENIYESLIWGMIVDSHKDNSFDDTSDKIVDYIIDTVNETAEQLKTGRKHE